MVYADLEIRIVARENRAGVQGYRVELTLDHGQEFGPGFADLSGITPWAARGGETKQQYGERLFASLFGDVKLKSAWDRVRGQSPDRRVRLRIDPELSELHTLQWELLRAPDNDTNEVAVLTATPFSRYLPQDKQPGTAVLKRPIKVLVAIANPSNLDEWKLQPVDAQTEYDGLLKATAGVKDEDGGAAIQFDLLPHPCTLDRIRDALKGGYHVLHFIGHGLFLSDRDAHNVEQKHAVLLLPDPAKQDRAARVRDTDIADMVYRQLIPNGT